MGRKSNKKKQRKVNVEPQTGEKVSKKPITKKAVPEMVSEKSLSKTSLYVLSGVFFVLAILLYANTFGHRFVLDDHGIIANNKMTKAPMSMENTKLMFNTPLRRGDVSDKENSLYRPFTKLVLNWEWNVFGGNPHHFHKMNAIFYGLLCMLIFWVLYDLFNKKWMLPFLITLLFTVHPIHTEVVANIKSIDEILAMLGAVAAMRALQLYLQNGKIVHLAWGTLVYAIALFSKESAVVFMGIFPLLVYFQVGKVDIKKLLITCAPLLLVAVIFILTRSSVLGQFPQNAETSIMDNLIVDVEDNIPMRFATAVMIVGFYIFKFFVPYTLACDYSYSTLEPVSPSHWGFVLTFLLCLAGFIYAIRVLKNRNKIAFGILWFFVTFSLASNVFFLIGTSFGERLLFAPSLGLCILAVGLLAKFLKKEGGSSFMQKLKTSPALWGILLLVCALYSYQTIARNKDWKNDYELFSTDIEKNPMSTHLLFYMGNHLPSEDRKEVLTAHMSEAGFSQQQLQDSISKEVSQSIIYFRRSLNIYPLLPADGYNQLGKAYFIQGQLDSALKYYTLARNDDTTSGIYTNNVGTVYFNRRQFDKALPMFRKASRMDTTEPDFLNNIGCVYGENKRGDSAIYYFKKANAADSLDTKSLLFLEMTYRALGDTASADYYKSRMIYVQQLRRERL